MTPADLKAQIRRDLSVRRLRIKRLRQQIAISDNDITAFYNANKQAFNLTEPQIHLAQVVVTALPDPAVRNLKNDDTKTPDQAEKKIMALEARIRQGEDFAMIAQNFPKTRSRRQTAATWGLSHSRRYSRADRKWWPRFWAD